MLVSNNIKKHLIKYSFFVSLFIFLQLNSGYAQGGISWRRPLLPGGSLLKYSDAISGQISIGISYEHEQLDKAIYGENSVPNYNKERTFNSSLTLITNYGITNYFSLTAFFPFRYILNEKVLFRGQNQNQYDGGKYFRESYGLGDIILQTRFHKDFLRGSMPIIFGIGLKLSNGEINATDLYGERISDNLQVGTGSIDPVFSIYFNKNIGDYLLSAGAFSRISGHENIYGYRYGNELHTLINIDYFENYILYGGIQFSYLLTTRDYYEYGKITRDRGGKSIHSSGKLGIKLTDNLDVEMTIQIPLFHNMNESQLISPMLLQFGSLYRFSIWYSVSFYN